MLRPYMSCASAQFRAWRSTGASMDDHVFERRYVCLQEDEDADERGEREAVQENVAENVAFVAVPLRCGAGNDDTLGVDHLAHDAAGAVGRAHQHGRNSNLIRGNTLEA